MAKSNCQCVASRRRGWFHFKTDVSHPGIATWQHPPADAELALQLVSVTGKDKEIDSAKIKYVFVVLRFGEEASVTIRAAKKKENFLRNKEKEVFVNFDDVSVRLALNGDWKGENLEILFYGHHSKNRDRLLSFSKIPISKIQDMEKEKKENGITVPLCNRTGDVTGEVTLKKPEILTTKNIPIISHAIESVPLKSPVEESETTETPPVSHVTEDVLLELPLSDSDTGKIKLSEEYKGETKAVLEEYVKSDVTSTEGVHEAKAIFAALFSKPEVTKLEMTNGVDYEKSQVEKSQGEGEILNMGQTPKSVICG